MGTTYESVDDLAEPLRRAAGAHGEQEKQPVRRTQSGRMPVSAE